MTIFLFWFFVTMIIYTYFGYPVLLLLAGVPWRVPVKKKDVAPPSISIIIPVHNEEDKIQHKIDNLLSLDYPKDRVEIIIVSDASDDSTADIVNQYPSGQVGFHELHTRTGKAGALNHGLELAQAEILVFTDAGIILEKNALRYLVHPFTDPAIGCVSGEDHIPGQSGEGLYGRYELMLRNLESRIGSIVGASGCLYAQRRSLCEPFPEGVAPDFFSVLVTIDKGFRAVTEPKATGKMGRVKSVQEEFQRKIRTYLRGMTGLMAFRHLLNPLHNPLFAFVLFSHKVLRWLSGFALLVLFGLNLSLSGYPLYLFFLLLQIVFYVLALLGKYGSPELQKYFWIRIPFFFCVVNMASIFALAKYIKGHRQEIWTPSQR